MVKKLKSELLAQQKAAEAKAAKKAEILLAALEENPTSPETNKLLDAAVNDSSVMTEFAKICPLLKQDSIYHYPGNDLDSLKGRPLLKSLISKFYGLQQDTEQKRQNYNFQEVKLLEANPEVIVRIVSFPITVDNEIQYIEWHEDANGNLIYDPAFYEKLSRLQLRQILIPLGAGYPLHIKLEEIEKKKYKTDKDLVYDYDLLKIGMPDIATVTRNFIGKYGFIRVPLPSEIIKIDEFKNYPQQIAELKKQISEVIQNEPNQWLNLSPQLKVLFPKGILEIINLNDLKNKKNLELDLVEEIKLLGREEVAFIRAQAQPNAQMDKYVIRDNDGENKRVKEEKLKEDLKKYQEIQFKANEFEAELNLKALKPSANSPINQSALDNLKVFQIYNIYQACLKAGRIPKPGETPFYQSRDPEGLLDVLKLKILELAKESPDPYAFFKEYCSEETGVSNLLNHHRHAFTLRGQTDAGRIGTILAKASSKDSPEAQAAIQELDALIASKKPRP